MKSFPLIGVDTMNQPVKFAKEVVSFTGNHDYFKVIPSQDETTLTLITPKNTYTLHKHATLNIYGGVCANRKVHISLKKIVGELRFW